MSCPKCKGFLKRVKGENRFEDIEHRYSRLKCSNCGFIVFASGGSYYPSHI